MKPDDPPTDYDDMDEQNGTNDRHPSHDEDEEQDGAPTQSESEDDEPNLRQSEGGETEDESDHSPRKRFMSPTASYPHHPAPRVKRQLPRVIYHPIVRAASEMCLTAGREPSVISYARLLGAGKGTVDFYVRARAVTVGRWGFGSDCQIKSDTRSISRKHAKLYWDSSLEHWMLTCLSKKNGMIVDGAPIVPFGVPVPLKSRALIEIGDVAFYFLAAAGSSTLSVNDVQLLEQQIVEARIAEENALSYEDANGVDDNFEPDEVQPARKSKSKERLSSKKAKAPEVKKSKPPAKKAIKAPPPPVKPVETSSESSSESEEGEQLVPDILDDPKYNLPLMQPSAKKRKVSSDRASGAASKKRRKRDLTYDDDDPEFDSRKHTEEWNKKEKSDFTRALFAVGVDAVYDEQGNIDHFDWTSFRGIAEFPKKTDRMLEEHYRRVMTDVRDLLDEEEREKKAKGPRNRHKPNCECSVCINTRRSGKKRRENDPPDERTAAGGSDREDGEGRGAATKGKDRLVGLVTAQKLRVRLGIHEAARRVNTEAGQNVFAKLETQPVTAMKELPEWWQPGIHDKDLMRGCARHGVGQWFKIWQDEYLETFAAEHAKCEDIGVSPIWPTTQATMKRVRDVASALTSETKRLAKRDALEERKRRKLARKREKKMAKRQSRERESSSSKRKQVSGRRAGRERSEAVNEDYTESRMHTPQAGQGENSYNAYGESTVEDSGSEKQYYNVVERADEIETEDEEEDVKVEVDEEMEVDDEMEIDANDCDNEGEVVGGERDGSVVAADGRPYSPYRGVSDDDGYGSGADTPSDSGSG